jgi:hypothetical protein
MSSAPNQATITYFHAKITLQQEGVAGATLIFIPLKTTGYKSLIGGVTLKTMLRNDLQQRLKQGQILSIDLMEAGERQLESIYGSASFPTYHAQVFR